MPNVDKHAPGDFCWVELGTTDQTATKKFYQSLFGWSSQDFPMGPSGFYTMFNIDGRNTGAAYTLMKEMREQGVPPHWMLYIAVESADATADKAAQLGAKLLKPPMDVFDVGRMAVIQDPTGAVFCVWQAKSHSGFGIEAVDGTFCWADLNTPDRERAGEFYSKLLGWELGKEDEDPAHAYWHIKNGEKFIGGMPPAAHRPPNTPAHWLSYFQVSDCTASANKAKELGANLYMPPTTMEDVGCMSIVADPQGAVFAIFKSSRSA
ncbi:MAG: VOC family protein [Terriglobia bacterium]|jgi:hypothetical protein